MKRLIALFVMLLGCAAAGATEIPALTYHDIVEKKGADAFAVTAQDFKRHIQYLKDEGYTPVSLDLLRQVREGKATLPVKPVLLTFDDGLKSFASHALPLLQQYGYPCVLSVVTAWLDSRSVPEAYQGRLLDWSALRTLASSPLVEIISHSDDLHRGIRSNPQGNEAPAGVTRAYDPKSGRHETEEAFRERLRADLARSRQRLVTMLGKAPVAVAWPYGAYDAVTVEEAHRLGMTYHLTLDEDPTTIATLPRINRITFRRYHNLRQLDDALTWRKQRTRQLRFVEIGLDAFAGRTPPMQEEMLSALLSRLQLLGVNAVVVDPFTADRKAAFFPAASMPMAANLLNRVLHQIETRLEIEQIFLTAPLNLPAADRVTVYRELARLHRFRGVIFTGTGSRAGFEALLRHHHPAIRIGCATTACADGAADFVFQRLAVTDESPALAQQVAQILAAEKPVLFSLDRPRDMDDARFAAALRALRTAGAAHYGYTNDEFQADRPALARIVRELSEHTVVGSRR